NDPGAGPARRRHDLRGRAAASGAGRRQRVVSADPEPPTLLLVDDEERILSALRRSLRREGWRILTTSDPHEAVRWLEHEPIGAVVSDHKMRGMSGLELLEAAARLRPEAARFLITGWPDA